MTSISKKNIAYTSYTLCFYVYKTTINLNFKYASKLFLCTRALITIILEKHFNLDCSESHWSQRERPETQSKLKKGAGNAIKLKFTPNARPLNLTRTGYNARFTNIFNMTLIMYASNVQQLWTAHIANNHKILPQLAKLHPLHIYTCTRACFNTFGENSSDDYINIYICGCKYSCGKTFSGISIDMTC